MASPMKLAIIGGGPSAFYVASRLLSLLPQASTPSLRVHIFDRLWSPHGLVRYGVAPDHPEVKNCIHKFDDTAQDPRFRFFGNVDIGPKRRNTPENRGLLPISLPLNSIFSNYSHVLFATGCTLPTLHPALPPSTSCLPALSLVHWYTQHPSNPPNPPLHKVEHVSIIGNGNVSLDVARMLLTNVDVLAKYDVPQGVLDVLSRSKVKHVSIIGRRGPLEAAFTMKELREMINLPEASMVPLEPSLLTPKDPDLLTRQQTRVLQLLQKGSKNTFGTTPKTWSLDFFRSPKSLTIPTESSPRPLLNLEHTAVDPKTRRAISTGEISALPTDLVVTSLGFHGEPAFPYYDISLKHLRATSGRIVSSTGNVLKNVYASGWAATGAHGVLASTMMDAYAVADTIMTDFGLVKDEVHTTPISPPQDVGVTNDAVTENVLNPSPHPENPPVEVMQALREGKVVEYPDWKKVDKEEVRRGQQLGKERERFRWHEARRFLMRSRTKS